MQNAKKEFLYQSLESFPREYYNKKNKIFSFQFEPMWTNSPKLQCWKQPRESRNPLWQIEYNKMVQLSKMWKDANQFIECVCYQEILAVNAFHLKYKARLSWNTAVLEFFAVDFNCVGNHFLEESFSEIS